ncbi:polysaccharide deacetylase family protein [Kineosporia sp. J2-2]|uniref:Polysaccharide deacetylase family protein n=1 Tax=Kineosporia corallincola TaxID=2835133 RepID=A0ABS5TNY7_9ACTN|nr:polysaccharide deacetylase family protein [Kineosporia corallincola]MBT0772815.1 polysaccharide deacetylase family protein [Kineosporia corallincola]
MVSRRELFRGALLAGGGLGTGAAAGELFDEAEPPPLNGGHAAAADKLGRLSRGDVRIHYRVSTGTRVAALTFDDGPLPNWTPRFLDALDEAGVPATFFLVGKQLVEHASILRGRLDRHEVGNHSWSHPDLATLDLAAVRRELESTHDAIEKHTGRTATLMRPPYGHLGGSTVLAAVGMGYDIVLWSRSVDERRYAGDPAGQAADFVATLRPGTIVLAHDAGHRGRLVTLGALPAIVSGLRAKGYRFVTVSELLRD